MRRTAVSAIAATAAALSIPQAAMAHGLVGKTDLPIPGWLFGWGAAAVLAISFLAFAVLWQQPKLETAIPKERFRIPLAIDVTCGSIGVLVMVGLIYAGFNGSQIPSENIVPTFVYVVFWTFLPVVVAVFGDLFRAFNPWRAIARAVGWTTSRALGEQLPAPFDYPDRLGRWPAVALLFGFGWLELVSTTGQDPSVLAALVAVYCVIQLVGMSLFGVETWTDRGDGFSVYFNMFSRLSPLTVINRRLATRPPLSGLTDITWLPGTVTFICTAIAITAFDGGQEGSFWQGIRSTVTDQAFNLGFDKVHAAQVTFTLGLLATIAIIRAFYSLGVAGMRSSRIDRSHAELARMFAPSLIPIMLAYVLAHYFSFVLFQGQAMWAFLSNPLGNGTDYFGTAGTAIDYGFLSSNTVWYFQVGILVSGHAAGLAVAHDKALAVWGKARAAVRSQVWMLVVMIGFTNLGLWLLSQSNA
ncbi:MAG TPA: fenitrothion hydrolase [Solirubrobacterales bacterium]|jgi:hypothetical protein|nr:fenitrothion hydrolase [Solirubrobacterales bacterium]